MRFSKKYMYDNNLLLKKHFITANIVGKCPMGTHILKKKK